MPFVYAHIAGLAIWMLLVDRAPWPRLTLVVSLEAIFLSTFVMIGQNRQAAFQQAKAERDFHEQEQELKINTDLTRQIHATCSATMRGSYPRRLGTRTGPVRRCAVPGPF